MAQPEDLDADPENEVQGEGPERAPKLTQAPNPLLMVFEARAALEGALGLATTPILRRAPKGDGHPVLVLPPFGAADQFTFGLRRFLKGQNYQVYPWGHPEVLGLHRLVHVAAERVKQVHAETGRQVTLIGHSLGGVYAREVARFTPESCRAVLTMGSPINDLKANHVWPMFEAASGTRVSSIPPEFATIMGEAPGVPTTSIFSKTDGVVSWRSCIDRSEGEVENIEVVGSHIGLPSNPWALYVVADRLAQPAGEWQPFHRPGVSHSLFPKPRTIT